MRVWFLRSHADWLEIHDFPIDQCSTRQVIVRNHLATAREDPGFGAEFDWERFARHEEEARSRSGSSVLSAALTRTGA